MVHRALDNEAISASAATPGEFAAVFDRHFDAVHAYLQRRIGRDLSDELSAETFLVAFDSRARYDVSRPDARPWLFGIATNLLHRHRRHELRELPAYARSAAEPILAAFDGVDARVDASGAPRPGASSRGARRRVDSDTTPTDRRRGRPAMNEVELLRHMRAGLPAARPEVRAAAKQPVTPGPGQYLFTRSQDAYLSVVGYDPECQSPPCEASEESSALVPSVRESWALDHSVGCYAQASLHTDTTIVHGADPIATCAELWREGVVDTRLRRLEREGKIEPRPNRSSPHLVACAYEGSSVAHVFPASGLTVCRRLGLVPLPAR